MVTLGGFKLYSFGDESLIKKVNPGVSGKEQKQDTRGGFAQRKTSKRTLRANCCVTSSIYRKLKDKIKNN